MAEKKKNTAEYIKDLASPIAKEFGVELWDVVFIKEGADWYLRLFIDKVGGINMDDCVNVTKAISPILDKEDPIPGEYTLEVSSCGIDRKLVKKEHFEAYLNKSIRVKLIRPLQDGTREIEGELTKVLDNGDFEVLLSEELSATFTKKECSSVNAIDIVEKI